jgi:hypothetical protein
MANTDTPAAGTEDVASLKSEIAAIEVEIRAAQTEDAGLTGGLIKSLVGARIAVLRETEAMLQQKLMASTFGISVHYAVDGKALVLPPNSEEVLAGVEQELADGVAKIMSQEVDAGRFSGGLVRAISLSTLATMRQTQAMLDQKRLALKYGLPQYLGFHSETDSAPAALQNTPPAETPTASIEKRWHIVSVDTRVTESNSVWAKYAWKLTMRNDSDQPQGFRGTIEFQDGDGFIVDSVSANDMLVPAKSEEVFTGFVLIRAEVAGTVARTVAKIGKGR